jgi:hypothetical protein
MKSIHILLASIALTVPTVAHAQALKASPPFEYAR